METVRKSLVTNPKNRLIDRPNDGGLLQQVLKKENNMRLFIVDALSYFNLQPAILIACLPATVEYFKIVFGLETYLNDPALERIIRQRPNMKGLCTFIDYPPNEPQFIRVIDKFMVCCIIQISSTTTTRRLTPARMRYATASG